MVFSLRDGEKLGTLTEFNPTFFGFALRKKLFALNCRTFCLRTFEFIYKRA